MTEPLDRHGDWARAARLFRPHRAGAALVAVLALVSGAIEALFLVVVAKVALGMADGAHRVDLAGYELSSNAALIIAAALAAARFGLAIASVLATTQLYTSVSRDIRESLAAAYLDASWATQHDERAGHLRDVLGTGASGATGVMSSVLDLINGGASLVALIAVAVALSPVAALGIVAALGVLGAVLVPLRRSVRAAARAATHAGLELGGAVSELSAMGLEMHVFGVRDRFSERIRELIQRESMLSRSTGRIRGVIGPTYTMLTYLAVLGAIAIVVNVVHSETAAVATVMLVMLRTLGYGRSVQTSLAAFRAALPRLEVLDDTMRRYQSDLHPVGHVEIDRIGPIDVRDVTFSYSHDTDVLHAVSFSIAPGEVIGVIGPSGAGKSTLVQLLLGLREPRLGTITVGGVDLRDVDRSSWTPRVAFVAQEAVLASGTIEASIRFFRPDLSTDSVIAAARSAHVANDVAAMPSGFATEVGQRGNRLSGGQRQRVAIARALVGGPELLIMDEPTSALDVRSEALIRQTIAELKGNVTVVIIAHRLSTLEACDRVLIIEQGRVAAFDTPAGLARDSAAYRETLALAGLTA